MQGENYLAPVIPDCSALRALAILKNICNNICNYIRIFGYKCAQKTSIHETRSL